MDDEPAELYSGLAYVTVWLHRNIEETIEKACRVFDYYESKNDVENALKAIGSIGGLVVFQKRSTPRVWPDYARRAFQLIDAESLKDPQILAAAGFILEDNIEDFGRIQKLRTREKCRNVTQLLDTKRQLAVEKFRLMAN